MQLSDKIQASPTSGQREGNTRQGARDACIKKFNAKAEGSHKILVRVIKNISVKPCGLLISGVNTHVFSRKVPDKVHNVHGQR